MNFEFATAQRIVFGQGKLNELPALIHGMGKRVALVTGTNAERIAPVFKALKAGGTNPAAFSISGEPTTDRGTKGQVSRFKIRTISFSRKRVGPRI